MLPTMIPRMGPRWRVAVWALPVMVLLVLLAIPFNDGFYEFWVNYDSQGDAQQREWIYATRIFMYTSGVLSGQLLALIAGVGLARRHGQKTALALAAPLGVLLAGVTFAVGYPLAQSLEGHGPAPMDNYVNPTQVLLRELATHPLDDPVLVEYRYARWPHTRSMPRPESAWAYYSADRGAAVPHGGSPSCCFSGLAGVS
jgi:hypothetical protein